MRRVMLALGALAILGLGSGCAKQLQRIELRTDQIATAQARLEQEQRSLSSALQRLDDRDAGREAQLVERRAELEAQLLALDRAVHQMDARAQEQEALLRRISAALDMLVRQVPATGEGSAGESGVDPILPDPSTSANPAGTGLESPGTDVFDAAFRDYTAGRYPLAREGFTEVLARFATSELADDAAYWVAETWYAEGDYEQAQSGFEETLRRWPQSDVVAPSLLKLAYCQVELGESQRAVATLQQLTRDHPDSDEALIAGHRLSTLQGDD